MLDGGSSLTPSLGQRSAPFFTACVTCPLLRFVPVLLSTHVPTSGGLCGLHGLRRPGLPLCCVRLVHNQGGDHICGCWVVSYELALSCPAGLEAALAMILAC